MKWRQKNVTWGEKGEKIKSMCYTPWEGIIECRRIFVEVLQGCVGENSCLSTLGFYTKLILIRVIWFFLKIEQQTRGVLSQKLSYESNREWWTAHGIDSVTPILNWEYHPYIFLPTQRFITQTNIIITN